MLGSGDSALEPSKPMLACAGGFPKFKIQSVSFGQLFGERAVVGSHLALSGQSRHGQSTMVSMDAGNLFG